MRTHRVLSAGVAFAILLGLMLALLLTLPGSAQAAPHSHHNRGLTIAATPDPVTAGEGVLIYGQLTGPNVADRRIWLFHRINPAEHFTPVSVTRTNASGFYEFVRTDGVVNTNRSWFVLGPRDTRSHTIHEWVSALVTLNASAAATTGQPVTFTGTAFPSHDHQAVLLQEQVSNSGTGWRTIATCYTNSQSSFTVTHRFNAAGSYTLRAFLPNSPRNIASQSANIDLTVQQQQNPSFTIKGSAPIIADGQSETITGTLYDSGSTATTQPDVPVTLYGELPSGGFRALASTTTDGSGNYSFTQMPLHNVIYQVRKVGGAPHQRTANLYVGVQDVVTAGLTPSTVAVGQTVKISGNVTPDHTGHVLYLQEQNSAGQWVDVASGTLSRASTFAFSFTPGQTGILNLRVQITGGPWNLGGVSATLPLTVSGLAPVSSLPPAS